jgi:hypothetical protein
MAFRAVLDEGQARQIMLFAFPRKSELKRTLPGQMKGSVTAYEVVW